MGAKIICANFWYEKTVAPTLGLYQIIPARGGRGVKPHPENFFMALRLSRMKDDVQGVHSWGSCSRHNQDETDICGFDQARSKMSAKYVLKPSGWGVQRPLEEWAEEYNVLIIHRLSYTTTLMAFNLSVQHKIYTNKIEYQCWFIEEFSCNKIRGHFNLFII